MKLLLYPAFTFIFLFFGRSKSYCQKTPEEFGLIVFNAFHKDSIENLYRLIPTLPELEILSGKLGINKDSDQYKEAISEYSKSLEEFKGKVHTIISDTLDNNLNWGKAKLNKVTWNEYQDSLSKIVPITVVTIYFTYNNIPFRIVMDDIFKIGEVWKMGNNIYMQKLK